MSSHLPEWKGPIEGFVVNFLHKNLWRIANTHTFDDAMQEAWCVFLRTAATYPTVETPQHFMALFKRSWINEFNDLSNSATAVRAEVTEVVTEVDEDDWTREVIGDLDNDGALAVMLRQAPREVLMVLNLFLNAPQELLDLAMAAWKKSGRKMADGDTAVERMLGLPAGTKPVTQTREYFGDGKSH